MKIIYVTDVHGDIDAIEKAFGEGGKKEIDAVVFGGDIAVSSDAEDQREFLKWFVEKSRRFREETKKEVLAIMGNDDNSINADILERATKDGHLTFLNSRSKTIGKWEFMGYCYISPTPFHFYWEKSEEEIEKELGGISSKLDPGKAVCIIHVPPFGTRLDILYSGEHVGSKAVTRFIRDFQPWITLHGHIHESPLLTKSTRQLLGRTLAVNPGNGKITAIHLEKRKVEVK